MDMSISMKFSDLRQDAQMADLYTTIYAIPKNERVKVLMSWLSNAYSDLLIPFLTESDVLDTFIVHVRLLDTFANNSSYEVVAQLASEFSDNFIKSQVIPNLTLSNERTADVTAHFQNMCEYLTCPSLIRKVMDVVTTDLTTVLIGRMLSENQAIAASTLSLLKTLLEFYCEDLWYDLILQYLLPMKHLLTSQRQKMLPDIEFHESTNKLLELIPNHVSTVIKPSLLAQHFLIYFQEESMRLRDIDSAVASSLPSSRSELQRVGLGMPKNFEMNECIDGEESLNSASCTKKTGCNKTYPMWIFQYDGTDILHAQRGYVQEPEEFFEDDLFSVTNQLNMSSSSHLDTDSGLPLSRMSNDEDNFAFASASVQNTFPEFSEDLEQETSIDDNFSTSSSVKDESILNVSIVKDKRRSFDNLDETDRFYNSYFGPFLNALYELLQRWIELDPDVLFTATEIISVLSSSRIPLINTLFLDMSLTLQPSFPCFPALLHGIRQGLDEKMKGCPDYILRNVWKSAAKNTSIPEAICQEDTNGSDDEDQSSVMGSLRRAINSNRSFRQAADEIQRKIGKRGTSFKFSDIFKSPTRTDSSPEFRLLNRAATPFESEEEENCAKIMALRSVLFTHWMLELGAIATHLCWGRKSATGEHTFELVRSEARLETSE